MRRQNDAVDTKSQTKPPSRYTFGDGALAAERLERLAAIFEPLLRVFVAAHAPPAPSLAFDLGCGPGYTTRALASALEPQCLNGRSRNRTLQLVGLDTSERYLELARQLSLATIKYRCEDITRLNASLEPGELVYARFLFTHLAEPGAALSHIARLLVPGGRLLVQETAMMASEHPVLARYYELVGELQRRHGQHLEVGRELEALVESRLYRLVHAQPRQFELDGGHMARVHAMNLATWRTDAEARAFDAGELDRLSAALFALADNPGGASVRYAMGELVLERR